MKVINFAKKCLLFISSFCFLLALCFSVGCESTKFVGFNDITIKVAYGSNASLLQYVTAIDENGKAYRCTVTVKDSEGNPVEVVFDRFNVTSMDGYTAVTKVKGVSRTITIIVEDRSAIVIEEFSDKLITGYVGKEYTVPEVAISKASGEVIVPEYKVFRVENNSQVEVPVMDRKFTPDERGVYTFEVSATDATGATATKTANFNVRSAMAENMLEDFNDKLSSSTLIASTAWGATEQIKYGDGFYTQWHSDFNGREGVIESALNTNLNNRRICTTFGFDGDTLSEMISQMNDNDYISIWFWLDKEGNFDAIRQENPQDSETWTVLSKITGKTWQEIKIYKNALSIFANLHALNGSGDQLFFFYDPNQKLNGVKYYIDSVSLIKSQFDNEQTPILNQEYSLPELSFVGVNGETIAVQSEIEITLSHTNTRLNISNNKTTFTVPGKYDLVYKCNLNNVDYEYVKNIVIENPSACSPLSLEDFCMNTSAELIKENTAGFTYLPNGFYTTWLSNYEGKSGVVETVLNDKYGSTELRRVNIKLNKTEQELDGIFENLSENGYLAINVWIDVEGNVTVRNFGTFGILSQNIKGRTWQTIKITKSMLDSDEFAQGTDYKMSLAKALASDCKEKIGIFHIYSSINDAIKIYLDDIYIVDYNLVNDSEPEKGVEYTLPKCYSTLNANGEVINQLCEVEVKNVDTCDVLSISDGKVTFSIAGKFIICYKYSGSVVYEKTVIINRLEPNVFEDFNDAISTDVVKENTAKFTYGQNGFYTQWLASHDGKTGVVETVLNDNSSQYRRINFKFNKTQAQIEELIANLGENDYIAINVWIDIDGEVTVRNFGEWGVLEQKITGKTWQTIKLTKTMLENEKFAQGTDNRMSFAKAVAYDYSEIVGAFYISTTKTSEAIKIYVDDIRIVNVD